jgi:hypothetical protein
MIIFIKTKEIIRPEFDYEANYSIKVTVFLTWLIYGMLQPITFVFVFVYYISMYFLDKYLILYWFFLKLIKKK